MFGSTPGTTRSSAGADALFAGGAGAELRAGRLGLAAPRTILALALGWRVLLLLGMTVWLTAQPATGPLPHPRLDFFLGGAQDTSLFGRLFVAWDSYWYLRIAAEGYGFAEYGNQDLAFLPAYPALIRGLSTSGLAPALAGVLLSTCAFGAALVAAHAYARRLHGPRVAAYVVLFVCVFPSAWVFHMVYTEGLFCAALFGFLWAYAAGRYAIAGWIALILPLTRGVGLAVAPAIAADLAWTAWHGRRAGHGAAAVCDRLPALAGAVAGWALVATVYTSLDEHPFGFLLASRDWVTTRKFAGFDVPMFASLVLDGDLRRALVYAPFVLTYAVAAVALVFTRRDMATWLMLLMMIMLLRASHFSQHRYELALLPLHVLLVALLVRRRLIWLAVPALAALQVLFTRRYLDWHTVP